MTTTDKFVLFVGATFAGSKHDYTMLKSELPPNAEWFKGLDVKADSGYQGIRTDYCESIEIPYKKPRKSKSKPQTELSEEQKAYNTALSKARIYVENAIGGAKRYNIVVHRFRNHRKNFDNEVIGLAVALWNFTLCY